MNKAITRKFGRYDLPLQKGTGSGFLVLVVALMVYLATLALSTNFALSAVVERWTVGLQGSLTIEIPAQNVQDLEQNAAAIGEIVEDISKRLNVFPGIKNYKPVEKDEFQSLVSPWLGDNIALDILPVPALITVYVDPENPPDIQSLQAQLHDISPDINIDTYEQWLADLTKFTRALQFASLLLTLVITFTTIIAIAGGTKSRIDVHRDEVELLHQMGASDNYIAKQFQRHNMIMALKGGLFGTIGAIMTLVLIDWLAGELNVALLPNFKISEIQWAIICMVPVITSLLAMFTARMTVIRTLEKML